MQIEVSDRTADVLRRLVETGRFRTPGEALDGLVDDVSLERRPVQNGTLNNGSEPLEPYEEWEAKFDDLLASARPLNPNVDDSRESIYPVR